MSMPVLFLKCQSCSEKWANRMLWGLFSYELLDGRLANIERSAMWCHECNSYCPVERLPEMEELEEKLAVQQQKLELVRSEKPKDRVVFWFIRKPGKIDTDCIRIYENCVADASSRIDWKKLRQSPRKCLLCGSQDIADQGDAFKSPQTHPGCGGTIKIEDPDLSIADRCMHKIYNVEAHFLREDVCKRRSAR